MPRFRSLSINTSSTPQPPPSLPSTTATASTAASSLTMGSPMAQSGTTSPNTLLSRGFRSLRRARRRSVSVPSSSDRADLRQRPNVIPLSSSSSSSSLPRSPLANQVDATDNIEGQQEIQNPTAAAPADPDPDPDADQQQQQHTSASVDASSPCRKHLRLVPNVGIGNRCFVFDIIERDLLPEEVLKIGRYSDRNVAPDRLSFKSKVVSRVHAELWTQDGKVYLRDIGSSSGTFVNRTRLAPAGQRSAPQEVRDGDVVQFGVDYQGGLEPMYRAVRMRVEINRVTPKPSQPFSRQAFQQLRQHLLATAHPATLADMTNNGSNSAATQSPITQTSTMYGSPAASDIQECCICLYAIAPLQALFITPCSHTFHFKCLRPILFENYPGFSCPICRTYADLEASVAVEVSDVLEALRMDYDDGKEQAGKGQEEEEVAVTPAVADLDHPLQHVETLHDTDQDQNLADVDRAPPLLEEEEESERAIRTPRDRSLEEEEEEEEEEALGENLDQMTAPASTTHHPPRSTEGLLSSTLVATPPVFENMLSARSGGPRS